MRQRPPGRRARSPPSIGHSTASVVTLGGPNLRSSIGPRVTELSRWRRPVEIGWVSESGPVRQEGGFRFTQVAGGTRIELRIAYEPPGFVVGTAIARRLDPLIRGRLQKALERIREQLES